MKKLFAAIVAVVALGAAQPAQAQFKFGLTGGLNITDMKFSGDAVSKDNREGFFIGPKVKFTLPVIGLAIDASAVYDPRSFKSGDETVKQKYINIPINVRYSLGLGSVASVFAAVGPQFGFNLGDKSWAFSAKDEETQTVYDLGGYSLKSSTLSANFSLGVTVLGHLEVRGTYNIALGKTGDYTVASAVTAAQTQLTQDAIKYATGDMKSNCWQIGVAYYF